MIKRDIPRAAASENLLAAMLDSQKTAGYLSEEAMEKLAEDHQVPLTRIYETASFYSMIRLAPAGRTVIQICRNAPCHVAGSQETVAALEEALGMAMGTTSQDGDYTLEYVECIGQCQSSPALLVNGVLYTEMTADKIPAFIKARAEDGKGER